MKKLILFLCIAMALPLAACKKKGAKEAADFERGERQWSVIGPPIISYFHDPRVDKCFYRAADWRMTSASSGPVLVLHETACTA